MSVIFIYAYLHMNKPKYLKLKVPKREIIIKIREREAIFSNDMIRKAC